MISPGAEGCALALGSADLSDGCSSRSRESDPVGKVEDKQQEAITVRMQQFLKQMPKDTGGAPLWAAQEALKQAPEDLGR